MTIDPKVVRRARLCRKAKDFATMVKQSNMAHKIPDDIIDWLEDDEVVTFKEQLYRNRLTQRKDLLWEENR
jgi:hypothetical protein